MSRESRQRAYRALSPALVAVATVTLVIALFTTHSEGAWWLICAGVVLFVGAWFTGIWGAARR